MYKNIRKETQNHAITALVLICGVLRRLTNEAKNNYTSTVRF